MGSVPSPEIFHYTKEGPLFQLRCRDTILADMSRVAIGFAVSKDGSTFIYKHGTENSVLESFRWAKNQYESLGLQWVADELCFFVTDSWDIDELNNVIHNEVDLSDFLRKSGIDHLELRGFDG